MARSFIFALFVVTLSPFAPIAVLAGDDVYRVTALNTMGGNLGTFATRVNALNKTRTRVVIDQEVCTSACTYFLLANDVCIRPDTKFRFHGPQNLAIGILAGAFVPFSMMPKERHKFVVDIMAADYNMQLPGLGDWFTNGPSEMAGPKVATLTGVELNERYNVPLCTKDLLKKRRQQFVKYDR